MPKRRLTALSLPSSSLGAGSISVSLDAIGLRDRVIEAGDLAADDDLILSAGLDDLDDTIGLLERRDVCQLRIGQREAQARYAVREAAHVLDASDAVDDGLGKSLVICHPNFSFAHPGEVNRRTSLR